ncbi:MAG: hypothetical protein GF331_05360 [Chitinivibrionales bacterium]|nr:hypothetical protein [Chitinivibrionales bacterium]
MLIAKPLTVALAVKDCDDIGVSDGQVVDVKQKGPLTIDIAIGNMPTGGSVGRIILRTLADATDEGLKAYYNDRRGIAEGAPVHAVTVTPTDASSANQSLEWNGRAGAEDGYRILVAGKYTVEVDARVEIGGVEVEALTKSFTVNIDEPPMSMYAPDYPVDYGARLSPWIDKLTAMESAGDIDRTPIADLTDRTGWSFLHHTNDFGKKVVAAQTSGYSATCTGPHITASAALTRMHSQDAAIHFIGHGFASASGFYDNADATLNRQNLSFILANENGPGGIYYKGTKWPDADFADMRGLSDEPELALDDVFLAVVASCHSSEAYNSQDVSIGRELLNKGVDGLLAVKGRTDEMYAEFWSLRFWELLVLENEKSIVWVATKAHEAAIANMLDVFRLNSVARLEEKFTDPITGEVLVHVQAGDTWVAMENPANTINTMETNMWPPRYGQKSEGN